MKWALHPRLFLIANKLEISSACVSRLWARVPLKERIGVMKKSFLQFLIFSTSSFSGLLLAQNKFDPTVTLHTTDSMASEALPIAHRAWKGVEGRGEPTLLP